MNPLWKDHMRMVPMRMRINRRSVNMDTSNMSAPLESISRSIRKRPEEVSSRRMPSSRVFSYSLLLITIVVLHLLPSQASSSLFRGQCPEWCTCGLDTKGRMEVKCMEGRMRDFPVTRINPSVEVIKIIPPLDQKNHLAIGGFFRRFKKLEELHIVNSNIPNIGEHSFWGVQSLRVLNLTSNNISVIIDLNFKGLVSLEYLSLADNAIESLVSTSFQHLPKLKSLNLSKNRISKLVERLFYNLDKLESLDISENWLRDLHPDVFRDVWRLKELRCRRCGIRTINPILYALLVDLQVLDLGSNEFKYLNREEFGALTQLRELYLDGNQISSITDSTFRSSHLNVLSLAGNLIARIGGSAFFNSTIASLDLSANKFDSLDEQTFSQIRNNLTRLDLSNNTRLKLSPLLPILGDLPKLKHLSLAYNNYEDLPLELFERQGELEHLNLSGNHLPDIFPHQFAHLMRLRVLDLSKNKLKGLDEAVLTQFDRMRSLQRIYLHGNIWACDLCHIRHLLRWVQRTSPFTNGCSQLNEDFCLRCASPPTFFDKALQTLDESRLEWCSTNVEPATFSADDPRLGLFIGCALILIILIVAALAVIFHSRWHAAHYYTHEEDRPEIGTPPLPPDYDHLGENEIVAGFDNHYYTSATNGKQKIRTIEDMTYDPHLTTFAAGPEISAFHQNNGSNGRAPTATSPMLRHAQSNNNHPSNR